MPPVEFLAERQEAGKTIAALLRKRFGLSWSQAKRVIEGGHVRVAGFAVSDPGHRVRAKNRIWVREGASVERGRGEGEKRRRRPRLAARRSRARRHGPPRNANPRPELRSSVTPSPPHALTPLDSCSTPTTRWWW